MQDTEPVVVMTNCCEIGGYKFLSTHSLVFEPNSIKLKPSSDKHYVLDKTNKIFRQKIVLPDYKDNEFLIQPEIIHRNNVPNGGYFELDLFEPTGAYKENKLKAS